MGVENILEYLTSRTVQLTTLVLAITTLLTYVVVFREQVALLLSKLPRPLAQLLSNISLVKYVVGKHAFQIEFGQQVQKAKGRAKGIAATVMASRPMPVPNLSREPGKQTGRDLVLAAWGALQQIVYDACTASHMPLTPATRIPEAIRRLGNANAINEEIAYLLNLLYDLGQRLADDPGLRPQEGDARSYKELADLVVDWMMLSVLAWGNGEESKSRRPTEVGGRFVQPQPGDPVALLVGISGPVRGQRFAMAQEHYRIGSNADNDLCITGDDYVSAHHASLRYEKGSLFLFDQGSRNGSFLNEKQVRGTPMLVRQDDQIRFGESVFQVAEAPTPQPTRRPPTIVH